MRRPNYMRHATESRHNVEAESPPHGRAPRAPGFEAGARLCPGDLWPPAEQFRPWDRHRAAPAYGERLMARRARISRAVKTSREIVEEVNDVARMVLAVIGTGYSAPEGYQFWQAERTNPRFYAAWTHAVEIYEFITGTEVHDALLDVQEALNPIRKPPAARRKRAPTIGPKGWRK